MLDLSNLQRISVVKKGNLICSNDWVERIKMECENIVRRGTDKLALNYRFESLDLFNHQAFDIISLGDTIVGWGGLYNGGRYPQGVFRIMNRLYLNPEFRSPSFYVPYFRKLAYPAQIAENKDEVRLLFLSRDELKGRHHVTRWAKKGANEKGWAVSDKMVQVANGESRGCYQYIAYKKYRDVKWEPKQVTEEEWLNLPR